MHSYTQIGITNFRSENKPIYIKDTDRLGHIYCIGKTGVGKSTLLLNMALSDIQKGKGVCIIDPHGDLAKETQKYAPKDREILYLDVSDTRIGCNPFSLVTDKNRYLVAESIVTALKKLWAESWGPRLEHILRYTLLTLSYHSQSTLLDIAPLLTDYEFRKRVLYAVSESSIHDFWQNEFGPLSPQTKNEYISPILNKVSLFRAHPILKSIFGQMNNALDIRSIMDNGKILIVNLSKGVLGEAGTALIGSLLVTQFQIASLTRATSALRPPFYLYIDEVHSFITKSFADILSESRKYGLSVFLTHQFLDQLPEDIHNAIIGNVGTLIAFRVGSADAKRLAEEFAPTFSEEDLQALPKYHIYLKLLIDGATSRAFSGVTIPEKHIFSGLRL